MIKDSAIPLYLSSYHKKVMLVLAGWFSLALYFCLSNIYAYSIASLPIAIMLAIILPVFVFLIFFSKSGCFKHYCLEIDIRLLILIHSFRTVGLGFVFLYVHGQLAGLFAYPAGIGDFLAAVFALYIGASMIYKDINPKLINIWNNFGIFDFVIAVSLGVTARSSLLGEQMGANSDIMTLFPLSMIPGFFVPFYLITHLIIRFQLKNN